MIDQRTPRPTPDEAVALAVRARAGDRRARDELIAGHVYLVHAASADYRGGDLDRDERVSIGLLALVEAAEGWDPGSRSYFRMHARRRIKDALNLARLERESPLSAGAKADLREARRKKVVPMEGLPEAGRRPLAEEDARDAAARRAALRARLRPLLARLRPGQRELVALRFGLDGLALDDVEVGGRIGRHRASVGRRIAHALEEIRAAADEEEPGRRDIRGEWSGPSRPSADTG